LTGGPELGIHSGYAASRLDRTQRRPVAPLAAPAVEPFPHDAVPPAMGAHAGVAMKENIHPPYHPVVFKDASTGALVLTRSTMTSTQKIKLDDGNEYPLILLEITSDSHPFYTGTQRLVDTQGRVDKFKKRYNR
jgi:large subunit ribosomal protein L31